jgi:NAD(P)-dependent dehydrogenase (short-subunit alcohol dehydrogenase family)
MFAGLGVEDESSSEEELEETSAATSTSRASEEVPTRIHDVLGGLDEDDIAITIETLQALTKDLTLFRSRPFKALREAIGPLARELIGGSDAGGGGGNRGRRERQKQHNSRLGALDPMERLKQMDRDAMNHRVLRAERLQRLEEIQALPAPEDEREARLLQLTHGGGDDPNASLNAAQGASLVPFQAGKAAGGLGLGAIPDGPAMASATASSDPALLEGKAAPAKLHIARSCYVCKAPYQELHAFYAQLCMECAELNWKKRGETCNLYGRVALVTGGRVKIGFRIVLKLLRCGCEVIASTRFPIDAVRRFAAEDDHAEWQHRLHVVGCDLRDLKGLEQLCDALPRLVKRLDIIINNACQTVRRPPQYYLPLLEAEQKVSGAEEAAHVQRWTKAHTSIRALLDSPAGAAPDAAGATVTPHMTDVSDAGVSSVSSPWVAAPVATSDQAVAAGADAGADAGATESILPGMSLPVSAAVGQSAMLSQLAVVPGDDKRDDAAFPKGRTDGNSDLGQQLDLRAKNSWMLKLEEVSTPEMAEVLAINALAPAVINGRLKALMVASGAPQAQAGGGAGGGADADGVPTAHCLKFIVNVSAMEGRFYKFKQPTHPHTNMAKAALNMMTRTSAADFAKAGIFMTAVDTGWINDEKPAQQAAADAATHNFQTPIDEIDAAARVLDPIIAPLRRLEAGEEAKPPSGCFLKDYAMCEW